MPHINGTKSGKTLTLDKDLNTVKDGRVTITVEPLNWWGRLTSAAYKTVFFMITLLGLAYLISIPFGFLGGSKRFELTDFGVFTSILLLNSDKLSKVQFGKEGLNFELVQEIKKETNEIKSKQGTLEANQNLIKTQQLHEFEKIADLQTTFERFLRNNEALLNHLKNLEDLQLPKDVDTLARSISEYVSIEVGKSIERNSPKIYEHIGKEIEEHLPIFQENLSKEIEKKLPGIYQKIGDEISSQISRQIRERLPLGLFGGGNSPESPTDS